MSRRSRALWILISLALCGSLLLAGARQQAQRTTTPAAAPAASTATGAYRALLDQYCVGCHNQRSKTAGLMFDQMDLADVAKHGDVWEKAIRKLRGGLMPPPGNRQPDRANVDSFVGWLETTLDQAAAKAPNPGGVTLHRLNRAEYANSIREFFGIDIDAAAYLPADDVSDGFDNIANVLKVSPSFLDQYITAARAVTKQAIGTGASAGPPRVVLRGTLDQNPFVEGGLPLGTQPVMLTEYVFPADGEYEFRINGTAIVTVDGARVDTAGRVAVKGGAHKVGLATMPRSFIESENALQSFTPGAGGAGGFGGGRGGGGGVPAGAVQVAGPYSPVGAVAEPVNRQRIFVCKPASEADEIPCATKIFSNIARLAFRRPLTEKDLAAPLAFFKDGRSTGDFETGIQTGLMTILASPKFLYRAEPGPANAASGSNYKITDLELASRLSFFLWSQGPDQPLLDLAVQKKLSDPVVLEQQVKRMLADPRSKSLVTNFAFQWLRIRDLDKIDPDAVLFPGFDQNLRQAFRREMEMFVENIIHENRNVMDFLSGDYTFVNERLAAHYGIPDIRGNVFRRVTLTDTNRFGLLGKGAVLMVTSYPNRTAPVLRGAWILENIMGTPPAAPPPDVEGFKENKEGEKPKTVREIMQQHRSKPSCNGCHGVMDPLGFALENFDAVGEYRAQDRWAGTVIDASGKLVDGTPVANAKDLRKALEKHPDQFVQTLTEKLMTYGLGRSVEYYDMPAVRKIVRDVAREDRRFSAIVMGIVKSAPFQMTRASAESN
jgi:mono/diheme cytochrome c family protein